LYKYLFGNLKLTAWQQGITIAASWAWGVSVIVGMSVFQQRGIEAFAIWAFANSITLALVGCLFAKLPLSINRLLDVAPAWLRLPFAAIVYVIQFFSVLVNITAIKTAFNMAAYPRLWVPFVLAMAICVFIWGFNHVAKGNIAKYLIWIVLLILMATSIITGNAQITASTAQDINWAFYGALILLCAPILDHQMWQRRTAFKISRPAPFVLASIFFAIYMVLVGTVAAVGGGGIIIVAVILLVAGSTLTSALSAVTCQHSSIIKARIAMTIVFIFALLCMAFDFSVLQLWVAYGSLRIPFAVVAIAMILQRRDVA